MSVSTSRHHADWLSLVEVSFPFVSARPGNLWVELGANLTLSEEAVEFAAS